MREESAPTRKRRHPRGRAPKPLTPAQLAARAAALPVISYPDLPVSAQKDRIAQALRDNQVIVVAGETGSGKTTQLPKIALEVGRGVAGMVGHTQPRRIAARAVAERIAAELDTRIGETVGYQVRFTDEVGPTTLVKLMTDGILLAEIGSDPLLTKYDTIIVDEAHERSLNIDFILGYLGTLLPRRPDLKVIITSATIDSQRFADHFSKLIGAPVPVIEVSGRAYPVEVRYRPLSPDLQAPESGPATAGAAGGAGPEQERATVGTKLQAEVGAGELAELGYGLGEDLDLETALCHAVDELLDEPDGDILVFLPGERDIREAQQTLADHLGARYVADPKRPHRPDGVEIVPLFARLSSADQHRIYAPHSLRRIVLATNIAETSLTVPQVRYVIDSGLARISRFSNKTKVQRLPIERVSQASASQRAGRAGRTSPGVAIRLFSQRDHLAQDAYTQPEIMRTSLAAVILQMSDLGLGQVADFPFLDRPQARAVRDGMQLLAEIGALDTSGNITALGRRLARLPIDPRLGRMLVEADKLGCASEVLVIVAALSIQDVRERPLDRQEQSDQAHARFADPTSDFITYLNMWRYLNVMSRDLSGSAFRRLMKSEFLHYLRFREWRDVVGQISRMCKDIGVNVDRLALPSAGAVARFAGEANPGLAAVLDFSNGPGAVSADEVHRAVLPGLLSNIGNWDQTKRNYVGARGTRFDIWPGSTLRRRTPDWVMAAELVETSRLFARTVAAIRPEWIEHYAGSLLKRSYSEPLWSRSRGAATVKERITLYGLTLAADRQVALTTLGETRIGRTYLGESMEVSARRMAHDMFLAHALVEGDWRENHHAFVAHNRRVMERAQDMSARLRDPALVPDEAARLRFFAARVPATVTSAASFNKWWKDKRRTEPDLLNYDLAELLPAGAMVDPDLFPDTWTQGDLELPLSYSFDPGASADGVTVSIPAHLAQSVRDVGFDWLVPGLRQDLCTALVRGLPKAKRRLLAPNAQAGEQIWKRMQAPSADQAATQVEADPYSLEASLQRLRAFAGAGHATSPTTATRNPPLQGAGTRGESAAKTGEATDAANAASGELSEEELVARPFLTEFAKAVRSARGIELSAQDLEQARASLPDHLRLGFRAVDERGAIIAASDSLTHLQKTLRKPAPSRKKVKGALASVAKAAAEQEQAAARALAQNVAGARGVQNEDQKWQKHADDLLGALRQDLFLDEKRVSTRWSGREALLLAGSPYPDTSTLIADAQESALRTLVGRHLAQKKPQLPLSDDEQGALRDELRQNFEDQVYETLRSVIGAVEAFAQVQEAVGPKPTSRAARSALGHARGLFSRGYLTQLPAAMVPNVPRYLRADAMRATVAARSPRDAELDEQRAAQVAGVEDAFAQLAELVAARPYSRAAQDGLAQTRQAVEELRVSLFAQTLGTSQKVSPQRLMRQIQALEREL